ncbi:phytanoyl-CoA dioxygenase family protein [Microlunatus parietis]|uniref:Ectoine hydroxylase-related dioxygenase (Phytanoyl-CoA dioxygenase family) n=1 Tax=Microlunatus parietis TaxID=682979 RepID=A0A7Y9LBJ2_9ACTN|nr:phytanoyl-CoA dioxygenase family protein [Microlunatus parietis]NYE70903.1 ectoine hydroxylase-related dioxygenase (phytanoyl-CoA dioxygenase family) [Microlunatus parietis]
MSYASTVPIDGETPAPYPEDLYRFDQPGRIAESVDQLSDADFAQFEELGYLAVRQLLTPDEVAGVLDAMAAVLVRPGEAMIQYEAWAADRVEAASGDERMDLVRKFMWFVQEDERLTALARNERILSVVRRLCGTEDITMMQDMALLKPPGGGREKPWHQDNAFFALEPGTPIVGVWLALDPATPENGCMHVMPGTHREGPVVHFRRRDWQLCDDDVDRGRDTMIPLPPGGALFFHGLLQHGTPANRTDQRRRAVQLHYIPAGTPQIPDQRRLDIFGSEGKNVTC